MNGKLCIDLCNVLNQKSIMLKPYIHMKQANRSSDYSLYSQDSIKCQKYFTTCIEKNTLENKYLFLKMDLL